ncbi:rod-binding protein [Pseudovibrio exalbescens]|uniref:rod-binding protein n=1 Tax=Pseudovibrio exalbescens TaxID=197461 RepID=UPI000426093E|nr:rod-binding protein [Pseudovibrio exalbescens]
MTPDALALRSTPPVVSKDSSQQTRESALLDKAREFEAVYLNQLMQTMFNGLETGGTFGSGPGADAWKSMMVNEYATSMAANGGIGLADSITRQLLDFQEI